MSSLESRDPAVAEILRRELERQRNGLEMIPSENFVSLAVLEALGSVLTNKYAEGVPGNRYYGGTANADAVENLARDRAKKLFGAEHANVQPLSGAPANIAAYTALLKPGETVLGMDLSHGGHLTHGHPVTFMANIFNFIRYGTTPEGLIDYEQMEKLAREHRPKLILVGYSSYSRDIDYARVNEISNEVGARTMADIAHIAGLIAAGEMRNPVPLFCAVTTTTHKTLRGPRGGMILCKADHAKEVDKAVFPGLQGGPHLHNIAAKAVAFGEALQPEFKTYARQVKANAKALCEGLRREGFPICFGTTENHLVLIDVTPLGVSGKQAQDLLDAVGITVNKNMIPDDPRKPMDPSGIRLGTPALTTRGFTEREMERIAELIARVVKRPDDAGEHDRVRAAVRELADAHPLYPELG